MMRDRTALIRAFVDTTDWTGAALTPLAGDASNRRYLRLVHPAHGRTAVLMDAPPDKGEDIAPFIRIAEYLTGIGLSAPRILDRDPENGLLLLEDLGDDLFTSVVQSRPDLETRLYSGATDLLIALHDQSPPAELSTYGPDLMADLAGLALDWYAPVAHRPTPRQRARFHAAMLDALKDHAANANVLIQRDYHAQNLLWLPERTGLARVGLLDFQDAMLGHPAYDLVSLLQDARRDVSCSIEDAMIDRYVTQTDNDPQAFRAAYAVLGAQRNLRILGVFARLCIRDGKPHYVDLLPRVWGCLWRDLRHPALSAVAETLAPILPEPTPEIMEKVKGQCVTSPSR